jgi:signal transduction histidine kinase
MESVAVEGADDASQRFRTVISDITKRKNTEAQLQEYRQHLEGLVKERTAKLEQSTAQLRNLAAREQEVLERERGHIAREVHDELGQLLTALKMDVDRLTNKLSESHDTETVRPLVEHATAISTLVDDIIVSVQRIAAELRPPALDDFGLAAAVEAYARAFQERTGIKCRTDLKTPDEVDNAVATAFFRIVQEALTNVTRHAEAKKVLVSVGRGDGRLRLLIKDDGKGIADEDVASSTSLGLASMRERALAVGGEFSIAGVSNKGTEIVVTVPCE